MMILKEQILSFLFCIIYGIIIGFLYTIIKKNIYSSKEKYNYLNSLFLSNILTLFFFKILYIINGGIISIYFIITTIFSIFLVVKCLQKKCKNKLN